MTKIFPFGLEDNQELQNIVNTDSIKSLDYLPSYKIVYAKNDIDVVERIDLNIINKAFECLWVEIRNEKHKNIVCGCLYRHPNTDIDDFREYISKCYLSDDFNIDLLKYD